MKIESTIFGHFFDEKSCFFIVFFELWRALGTRKLCFLKSTHDSLTKLSIVCTFRGKQSLNRGLKLLKVPVFSSRLIRMLKNPFVMKILFELCNMALKNHVFFML